MPFTTEAHTCRSVHCRASSSSFVLFCYYGQCQAKKTTATAVSGSDGEMRKAHFPQPFTLLSETGSCLSEKAEQDGGGGLFGVGVLTETSIGAVLRKSGENAAPAGSREEERKDCLRGLELLPSGKSAFACWRKGERAMSSGERVR